MTTDLIRNALETIRRLANDHLQSLDKRGDDWVVLTSLIDHDGSLNQATRGKAVMTVFNITRETTMSSYQPTIVGHGSAGSNAIVAPPLYVDVNLVFLANFTERSYSDGLIIVSRLISYFQQTPCFTHDNASGLASVIDKLTLEMVSLSLSEVHDVMDMLGTRYLPSVFYKLRMIPFMSPMAEPLA